MKSDLKRYGFFKTIQKIMIRILKLNRKNTESAKQTYQKWILQNELAFSFCFKRSISCLALILSVCSGTGMKSVCGTYQKWILQNEPSCEELEKQRKNQFPYEPKISIVVPLYNTNENFFLELLNSLLVQTYGKWELCIADFWILINCFYYFV